MTCADQPWRWAVGCGPWAVGRGLWTVGRGLARPPARSARAARAARAARGQLGLVALSRTTPLPSPPISRVAMVPAPLQTQSSPTYLELPRCCCLLPARPVRQP